MSPVVVQNKAREIYHAFISLMSVHYNAEASHLFDDHTTDDVKALAIKGMVDKKVAALGRHVRLVVNNQYAFVQWDPDYKKTDDEERSWNYITTRPNECLAAHEECVAVQEVYSRQGLPNLVETQSPLGEGSGDSEESRFSSPNEAKKKRREARPSGSSAQHAADTFAEAMRSYTKAAFVVHPSAEITSAPATADIWFQRCMLNEEQRQKILRQLPASEEAPSVWMLAMMGKDEHMLQEAGLVKLQCQVWKELTFTLLRKPELKS